MAWLTAREKFIFTILFIEFLYVFSTWCCQKKIRPISRKIPLPYSRIFFISLPHLFPLTNVAICYACITLFCTTAIRYFRYLSNPGADSEGRSAHLKSFSHANSLCTVKICYNINIASVFSCIL